MNPIFLLVMGVSGCGKTTVAHRIAQKIDAEFLEGDDFHSRGNKAKMAAGIPLTDEDRRPWLDHISQAVKTRLKEGKSVILACSALKQSYRDRILSQIRELSDWHILYLRGNFDQIKARMDARNHEYMTSTLLRSQFDTLEGPVEDERTRILSTSLSPEQIALDILAWIDHSN